MIAWFPIARIRGESSVTMYFLPMPSLASLLPPRATLSWGVDSCAGIEATWAPSSMGFPRLMKMQSWNVRPPGPHAKDVGFVLKRAGARRLFGSCVALAAAGLLAATPAPSPIFGTKFEDGTMGRFSKHSQGNVHLDPISMVIDADPMHGQCLQFHVWAQGETGSAPGGSNGPHFRAEINRPSNGEYTLRYDKTITWRWSHKLVTWPTWPWSADQPAKFVSTYPDIILAQIHHWKSQGAQGFELVDASTHYAVNFDGTRFSTGVPVVRNQWEDWELIATLGPAVNRANNIHANTTLTLNRKVGGQYVPVWTGTKSQMLWQDSGHFEKNGWREPYLKNGIYDHYRRGDLISSTGYSRNGPELILWCSEAHLYDGIIPNTPASSAAPTTERQSQRVPLLPVQR